MHNLSRFLERCKSPSCLSVLLSLCISFTRGYLIDDRDSAITYIPTSGSSAWIRFADAAAYMGDNVSPTVYGKLMPFLDFSTDNSCKTEQGCPFRFSFTGSGVSLIRFIITSIPIPPLSATVIIDGIARPMILIPDGSPNVTVYDIQSLGYGSHSMEVTLVSYNGDNSHFRLDPVLINQTVPYSAPLSPSPTTTSTPTPAGESSPPQTNLPSRNVSVGAVVGGTLGGLAVVICMTTWLLLLAQKRRRINLGSEKIPSLDSGATGTNSPISRLKAMPIATSPPPAILPNTSVTSTGTVVGTRSSQCPSDGEVEFVTVRYGTRIPTSDVARIVENTPRG